MNIYTIVEGDEATKKIYQKWIPIINKELTSIDYLYQFRENNFLVFKGKGQGNMIGGNIQRAINDVNNHKIIDRLVIAIDSEQKSKEEKFHEVNEIVKKEGPRAEVKIIIQHFCLETWLLGNEQMFRKKPKNFDLIEYEKYFDIRINDPEELPCYPRKKFNRSQFAYDYLRSGIKDIFQNRSSYSKRNPGIVLTDNCYFNELRKRCENKKHINSFKDFVEAFG